ncbi:VWA domain-containing protein [Edaphobacter albus]|uniref:VWA domain-containing protein n=1 Tax=Edaphobacter sp. 4G125 TaxID=2763071 RepID=UPI00164868A0|nr:VWA domain-containing protein [Edaphobacter sp. 4G125]QNI35766.1 VWA domain-containing protein [Edaphobacter sp. 4G125]
MRKDLLSMAVLSSFLLPLGGGRQVSAQDDSRILVNVVLVQLNIAVTDRKGNYISGLKPEDFVITEDKIPEKVATFEEGNEPTRRLVWSAPEGKMISQKIVIPSGEAATEATPAPAGPMPTGSNVFILFDTSNYMYRGFVFAQDAIADFVRSLEGASRVALYSYSRDLLRAVPPTSDRATVLRGVRSTVAGDDAALYNSLLMTVKDAAQFTGRKAIVVFSNGPDNASLVPPEDVAELAQSTGTIIYMISTRDAQAEPISTAVFERMSKATGGKAYFAKSWKDEKDAFASIREDLAHLYSLSYYPQPNPNRGWRSISVKLVGENAQKYRIRTRDGYRVLKTAQVATATGPMTPSETSSR